jgi:thermitase
LVKFKPETGNAEIAQLNAAHGARVIDVIPQLGVRRLQIPAGSDEEQVAAAYKGNRNVVYAEPDYIANAVGNVNDPYYLNATLWGLLKVQAPQAWDVTTGSPYVSVAILDTGIDLSHPDLWGKIIASVNFSSSTTDSDMYGHGTHVAGIVAAATNNGVGVAGIGYNSSLINVKVLGDDGSGSYAAVANGIIWAADHGARVINMSLGGTMYSATLESAVNYAWSKGVVVVAAAGNDCSGNPSYPAAYSNTVAVAATNADDTLASFSNRGDWVDISAPGVSIYSTVPTGTCPLCATSGYRYASGTSMASPFVSGVAALSFAQAKDTDGDGFLNDEVRNCLEANADSVGGTGGGSGRMNALLAVQCSSGMAPGSVAGIVTDAATAAPLAGATVMAGSIVSSADSTGHYTLRGLTQGTYNVSAAAVGHMPASKTIAVPSGQTATADLALQPVTGAVKGVVREAATGSPIVGARVSAGTVSSNTDSAGAYTLGGLAAGTYTITADASGYVQGSQPAEVLAGQTVTLDLSLNLRDTTTPMPTPTDTPYPTCTPYPSPAPVQAMWVSAINFRVAGKNLRIEVNVMSSSGPVAGATVELQVSCGKTPSLKGTTDSTGSVAFVQKGPGASCVATVSGLTANGFVWDASKGVKSATYTPK